MIGALGALTFTAAATLTRLAPQFGSGVVSKRPMESLLVEAGIRGVAVPLTAAAAGGLIGAALWFKRPPSKEGQHPGVVRALLVSFAGGGAGGVCGPWPDRRRPLPAGADVGAVPRVGGGGAVPAARRVAPGAVARSPRRDPVRRTAALRALRTCRSRYGVLSGLRCRDAGVIAVVTVGSDVTCARCAATRSPTDHEHADTRVLPRLCSAARNVCCCAGAHVACPGAVDLVQRDRGGGRRVGRRHVVDRKADGALHVPAGLRATADGHAGGGQSAVHRARRLVLRVLSGRGRGIQGHHQTQWDNGGSACRRWRHAAVVQPACRQPVA